MTPLTAALKYAAAGHPVLPVAPGGNVPLASLVPHGLRDASTEPATIRSWYKACPGANVALRTDGLLVLDIDPGGEESLRALTAQHGPPPATREQRTPRGGRHLLFRLPPGVEVGNSTSGLGSPVGLHVRACDRGYVVVCPSVNGDSGYRWTSGAPIADAPAWLVLLLERRNVPPAADRLRTAITRACKATGLPAFSPHDLGHRRASLWHLSGVPLVEAASWLGHSPQEHLRTYAHVVLDRTELEYRVLLSAHGTPADALACSDDTQVIHTR